MLSLPLGSVFISVGRQCLHIALRFVARATTGKSPNNLGIQCRSLGTIHTLQPCGKIEKLLSLVAAIRAACSSPTSKELCHAEYDCTKCNDVVASIGAADGCQIAEQSHG